MPKAWDCSSKAMPAVLANRHWYRHTGFYFEVTFRRSEFPSRYRAILPDTPRTALGQPRRAITMSSRITLHCRWLACYTSILQHWRRWYYLLTRSLISRLSSAQPLRADGFHYRSCPAHLDFGLRPMPRLLRSRLPRCLPYRSLSPGSENAFMPDWRESHHQKFLDARRVREFHDSLQTSRRALSYAVWRRRSTECVSRLHDSRRRHSLLTEYNFPLE